MPPPPWANGHPPSQTLLSTRHLLRWGTAHELTPKMPGTDACRRLVTQSLKDESRNRGFDHGVGHPLLLLYDAKAPLGKNSNYFGKFHVPDNGLLNLCS